MGWGDGDLVSLTETEFQLRGSETFVRLWMMVKVTQNSVNVLSAPEMYTEIWLK